MCMTSDGHMNIAYSWVHTNYLHMFFLTPEQFDSCLVPSFQRHTCTLPMLLCFSDNNVKGVQQIRANYSKFGLQLNDNNGTIVKALEKQFCQNAEDIVIAIFGKWLEEIGEKPMVWSILVATLQTIHM